MSELTLNCLQGGCLCLGRATGDLFSQAIHDPFQGLSGPRLDLLPGLKGRQIDLEPLKSLQDAPHLLRGHSGVWAWEVWRSPTCKEGPYEL